MAAEAPEAKPAPATERRIVAEFPPWLASVRYVNGALVLTVRVPVPSMEALQQLAWQREQADQSEMLAAVLINGTPPAPATFDLELHATDEGAEAIADGLRTMLDAKRASRGVLDVG